ncbi:MAG: ribosome biogenesis GTPase YqeH [Streptococcaceae bacterium]|nr:ribosome biogenesis GTPase YqeH [Streptococcaceae bacterium]
MDKNEELRCIGCGAVIQTEAPKELGYLPQAALDKKTEDNAVYCQRCFRLRNYNEIAPTSLTDEDFQKLLLKIGQKNALVVNVVDIFDLNGSMIPDLQKYVGKNDILVVANKLDVLPHSLNPAKLTKWVEKQMKAIGLKTKAVLVMSAKREYDIYELLELVATYKKNRDVYIVGVTNVGKSTLTNAIIKYETGMADLVTTSRFPGTTLDQIELPLNDDTVLIDTPGIIHKGQMAHYLSPEDLKLVSPKKEIKPKTWQLNPDQTLFLGGLARFDFVSGSKQGFTTYFDNELSIHRTKLEGADEFYQKHAGELLVPSVSKDLVRHEFNIKTKSDIVVAGLGWICVAEKSTVVAWAPAGVDVLVRKALV